MGLFTGRHKEVLLPGQYERAKRAGRLPDLFVASGELDSAAHDPEFEKLLDVRTTLPDEQRRKIELEENYIVGR